MLFQNRLEVWNPGALDVLGQCKAVGLPEPDFAQDGDQFTVTLWRDTFTPARLDRLGLNERQKAAIAHFRRKPELTNAEYQSLTGVSRATAKRDLDEMVKLGILVLAGAGRSAHYRLADKRLMNGPNGSPGEAAENGS